MGRHYKTIRSRDLLLLGGLGLLVGLGVLLISLLVLGEAGVLTETLKLCLDVLHVVGELGAGLPAALALGHAGEALGLAVALEPPEEEVSEGGGDANDEEGTEDGEALGVLLEAGGKTEKDEGKGEEHDEDVHDGESTPDAGGFAELAGEVEGDTAHEGDGVPDEDTGDVEEEMGKGGLHGGDLVGNEGGHDSGEGGTDVGAEGEGVHLLELDDAHADEGGEGGGGDGRGLDKDGDASADDHGEVSVDVGGLVDDAGGGTEEHLLEEGDEADEANDEDEEGKDEADAAGDLVVVGGGTVLEEGGAEAALLVAGDEAIVALAGVVGLDAAGAVDGVVVVAGDGSLGDGDLLDEVLVGLDDAVAEGGNDLLDGTDPLVALLEGLVGEHGLGEVVEVSGGSLEGEEDEDGKEVEHVVDGGTGEGTLELVAVAEVAHGNDGVGDGGTDVGTHDHVDGLTDLDGTSTDEGDDDGGGGRGGLKKDGGKDTDHEGGDGVGLTAEDGTGGTSANDLGGGTEELQTQKEEVKEEAKDADADEDDAPLLGGVAAAGTGDLAPGGVADLLGGLLVEVGVAEVGGAGEALLAALDGIGAVLGLDGLGLLVHGDGLEVLGLGFALL